MLHSTQPSLAICFIVGAIHIGGVTLAAEQNAKNDSELTECKQDFFSVGLPPGFQIKKSSPVDDFDIYAISKAGTPYAFVYVGNHPDFPRPKELQGLTSTDLETPHVRIRSVWQNGQLRSREYQIDLEKDTFPTKLHAWTADLPDDQIGVADMILSAIKTRK